MGMGFFTHCHQVVLRIAGHEARSWLFTHQGKMKNRMLCRLPAVKTWSLPPFCACVFLMGHEKHAWAILTYVHVIAGTCLCVAVLACVCAYEGQGTTPVVLPQALHFVCFETASAALEL